MNVAPSLFAVWDPGVNELQAAARLTVGKFFEIMLPEPEGLQEGALGSNISPHRPLLRYLCKYNLDLYPCQYLKTKDYTT